MNKFVRLSFKVSLNSRLTCLGNRWWGKASSAETIVATSFLAVLLSKIRDSEAQFQTGLYGGGGEFLRTQCNRKGVGLNAWREVLIHTKKHPGLLRNVLRAKKARYCNVSCNDSAKLPWRCFVRRRCWILLLLFITKEKIIYLLPYSEINLIALLTIFFNYFILIKRKLFLERFSFVWVTSKPRALRLHHTFEQEAISSKKCF